MLRLDHVQINVKDWKRSRDWYRDYIGFAVEFEIPERKTVAMTDEADVTLFLQEGRPFSDADISFAIQVDDVEAKFRALDAKGIAFVHPPQKAFWGYGAELRDPDGYCLRLWDPVSMKAKGGG